MTASGRAQIALAAIIGGICAIVVGVLAHEPSSVTGGASIVTLTLGYAFGDRNGEKRLADALTVLEAARVDAATVLEAARVDAAELAS